jgi:SHAQKYF class myb-like DNA-binding protein
MPRGSQAQGHSHATSANAAANAGPAMGSGLGAYPTGAVSQHSGLPIIRPTLPPSAAMPAPPAQPHHVVVERGCQKKTRLVWTAQLHTRFLFAVEQIGLRTAVPRTILQVMSVDGLTRENIASHLQKYRRLLEKKAGLPAGGTIRAEDWPLLEAAQRAHLVQARPSDHSARCRGGAGRCCSAAFCCMLPTALFFS